MYLNWLQLPNSKKNNVCRIYMRKYGNPESTKQMEEKLSFKVPAEGLELVILLHTQY